MTFPARSDTAFCKRYAATLCAVAVIAFPSFSSRCCARNTSAPPETYPVIIDYFYEKGCPECVRVREVIMPELEAGFEGCYRLNWYDIGLESNVIALIQYEEKLGIMKNEPVCMVVDYRYVFSGLNEIMEGLFPRIDECIAERMRDDWKPPEPIVTKETAQRGAGLAEQRIKNFTLPLVAGAGLVDGINPCAIGTLVFFMSLLAVSGIRGRTLLLVGISFCVASFVTYTALGFGLLRMLHAFSGFTMLQRGVDLGMILILGVFAFLSFRDAYRYRASGNPRDLTLQLPGKIKERIHKIMRTGLRSRSLVLGALVIGMAVTILESACTGQVYIPTLVLVVKRGQSVMVGLSYLVIYNAMFILPLVAAFAVTYRGLKTEQLIAWSRRNVVPSKILLGILFLAMAGLIWLI